MANITITTYCNLHCPYCFANGMCDDYSHTQHISMEQLRRILQWLAKNPYAHNDGRVGLIGGEPTLHPQFSEILKEINIYCREVGVRSVLFTNGIYLDKYVAEIGDKTTLLIGANAQEDMSPEQWKNFNATLDHINLLGWLHNEPIKARLGCNIHMDRTNYDFIWELIDRYRLSGIRLSVTCPVKDEQFKHKEDYYNTLKPRFMGFIERAEAYGIRISADCNYIPTCYFTDAELNRIYNVVDGIHAGICEPCIDITPDFKATSCFGQYDNPIDCSMFETADDLRRYLLHKCTYPLVEKNCTGKCVGCEKHDLLLCQGGCLAFAKGVDMK